MQKTLIAILLASASSVGFAATKAETYTSAANGPRQATADELAAYEVGEKLRETYPDTVFTSVKPSPMKGLYEVVMGKRIVYTNSEAKLLVFGRIVDLQGQKDLTADRIAEVNAIKPDGLPVGQAIKTVRGNGSRVLYVFSDPDCPYCKRLESTLKDITNVTIYTFLYPLEGLHPEATAKSESLWCGKEKDRSNAWADHMVNGKAVKPAKCSNPISSNVALGRTLGIQGTPFMINSKGLTKAGALPAQEIEMFLSGR